MQEELAPSWFGANLCPLNSIMWLLRPKKIYLSFKKHNKIELLNIYIYIYILSEIGAIIRRKCNSMVNLSKFTSNKKILSETVVIGYNQICSQTLFINYIGKEIIFERNLSLNQFSFINRHLICRRSQLQVGLEPIFVH